MVSLVRRNDLPCMMRESELLAYIAERARQSVAAGVLVGPGDDCAVLAPSGRPLVVTTDQLVGGRHFANDLQRTDVALIARKAVGRGLSDIAAMGARPLAGLAAAALPQEFAHQRELVDALHECSARLGAPLVGGDIAATDGPMVLTMTYLGEAPVGGAILRSGARAHDAVYVTGRIGGAVTSGRHLRVTPRLAEGAALAQMLGDKLHAMIDISDGLGRDAGRVAKASQVRVMLELAAIPRHDDAGEIVSAIAEGEDYELLFTVAEGVELPAEIAGQTILTRIGRVAPDGAVGCFAVVDGKEMDLGESGWDHAW